MARYSEELIEEVRTRNDIVDVIGSYVKLKRQGSNYIGLCPFHSEKSPSFSVSPSKQMYYCFGCHAGGNVITFIEEYENFSFLETMAYLAERAGIELPKEEMSAETRRYENEKKTLLEINKKAAKYFFSCLKGEEGKNAYAYFRGRELSDETILHFGLGYSGKGNGKLYQYLKQEGYSDALLKESGLFTMKEQKGAMEKFWNRVMFPIMDVNNRVIGFGGRTMGDGMPKYLNSPETKIFDKSRNLYGLNYARSSRRKNILLCEGYMDVIALHQAGFNNAVASLGTAFTGLQANLLKRYTEEVLLTYDSDDAGVNAALRAIPILKSAGITVKIIHMDPYKDPDEFIKNLGQDAFQERIDKAENSFFFEISVLERQYDFADPEQKTGFQKAMAKRLLSFTEELERNNYIEALAVRYSIPVEELRRMVNRMGNDMLTGREPGPVPRQDTELQERRRNQERHDTGMQKSYRLLLTWLTEETYLYKEIKGIIQPKDFREPLYERVAELLFGQFESGDTVMPARIINDFTESEEQNLVAEIFHTPFQNEMSRQEKEKAFNELIKRIKEFCLEEEGRVVTDVSELQKLIREKSELQKLHISLKDG